jgi:hypothetical protein
VPAKANRCPHCWSALAPDVTDFCPFCRGSVAGRPKRRRGDETPPPMAAPRPPEPYRPYEDNVPVPAPPEPPAADHPAAAAAAPAAGAVAVAERDPVEFPGTPLPPEFFDARPEKVRHRRHRPVPIRNGVVVIMVVVGVLAGINRAADREEDLSSPAHHLIADACAEYRAINDRLENDISDEAAVMDAINWLQSNVDRFAEAALLDPELIPASEVVTWFDDAIDANGEPLATMTDDEFDAREKPLAEACYNGPGRA